jgi:hypothetical protein
MIPIRNIVDGATSQLLTSPSPFVVHTETHGLGSVSAVVQVSTQRFCVHSQIGIDAR